MELSMGLLLMELRKVDKPGIITPAVDGMAYLVVKQLYF